MTVFYEGLVKNMINSLKNLLARSPCGHGTVDSVYLSQGVPRRFWYRFPGIPGILTIRRNVS